MVVNLVFKILIFFKQFVLITKKKYSEVIDERYFCTKEKQFTVNRTEFSNGNNQTL